MNKIILFILALSLTISANAQLTNGSVAPDFTVTDINGNSHTLSTYINAGKKVIIEFSGIMCGPSYKYKQTGALADFYYAYGPQGSNEVVVLFIEDGPNSSYVLQGLNGIYNPPTFGNWIQDTPFPIAISQSIPDTYNLNYVPYLVEVCSNGLLYNLGQQTASSLRYWAGSYCGTLTGVQNHVKILDTETGFCSATGSFKTNIKNYGVNLVTSMVLKLKQNGSVVSTKTFTGTITQFSNQEIAFDPITLNSTAQYTVEVATVNGVANRVAAFSTANATFHSAIQAGVNVEVKIHTYRNPDNMTWKIKNSAGTEVVSGGPYPAGAPYANSVLTQTATLPNTPDCYTVELLDSHGYGWRNYNAYADDNPVAAGLEIISNSTTVFSRLYVGNFGSSITYGDVFRVGTLGIEEPIAEALNIYPNPTTGIIRIETLNNFNISIYDMMGKLVIHSNDMLPNSVIDMGHLQKGIYIAKVIEGDKSYLKKIALQ
jgi:hypothetical protein